MCFVIFFSSCDLKQTDVSTTIVVRSVLESLSSGNLNSKVYLEGSDGQAVNGALVYILTPANEINLLDFDYSIGCYTTTLGASQSGVYSITIESRAYDTVTQNIEYVSLGSQLNFTAIQDEIGADALKGDNIGLNRKIYISWDDVETASAFSIILTKPDGSSYTVSVTENSTLIDAEEISEEGNYSVYVNAQYISGDPFFEDSDYYAVNELKSSTFYFEVAEIE